MILNNKHRAVRRSYGLKWIKKGLIKCIVKFVLKDQTQRNKY